MVVRYRLDSVPVIVDVGGVYGGGVTIRLKDNGIEPVSFVASWESIEKTKDGQLTFAGKRRCGCYVLVGRQCSRCLSAQRLEMGEVPGPASALDCLNDTKKHRTLVERGAPAHSCVQFQAQSPPVPNLSAESTACRPAISLYPSAAVIQAANGLSPSH